MEFLTSVSNPKLKRVAALQQKARARREEKAFVIEGIRLFLDTPERLIREVYVSQELWEKATAGTAEQDGRRETTEEICGLRHPAGCGSEGGHEAQLADKLGRLSAAGVFCAVLPEALLRRVSDTQTPQGVLCVVQRPKYTLEQLLGEEAGPSAANSHRAPLLLILEDIQDPGNLGTMIRTAEAAGATGIVMSAGTVDVTNPKTVRATMSALFRLPFLYTDDMTGTMRRLQEYGIKIYAAHLDGAVLYDASFYIEGTAFLIGNEGSGLTPETAAAANQRIYIPMQGQIESLNAAAAAGILLYEADRQRRHSVVP